MSTARVAAAPAAPRGAERPAPPAPPAASPGAVVVEVSGGPDAAELAAVLAAIDVLRAEAAAAPPPPPAVARSGWRRAAIEEGLRGPLDPWRAE